MISTSIGTTVLIMDQRDGQQIWMAGSVIEMKSLSPFVADRDVMLYNRSGSDEASQVLRNLSGPHNEQRLIARVRILSELVKDRRGSSSKHQFNSPPAMEVK